MKTPSHSFVIDFETTGFCPIRASAITLGVVVLNDNLDIIDEAYFKFKPDLTHGMNEDNVATHVHKITLNEMLHFPERRDSVIALMHFLAKYKRPSHGTMPLFYHATNAFDYSFLEWIFRKEDLQYSLWRIFDQKNSYPTVLLARDLGYEGNKLEQWAVRMCEVFIPHHALEDAKVCAKLIKYILNNNFQGNVNEFFTYLGREKNEKVQEVPENGQGFFSL